MKNMARITYINYEGERLTVEVADGLTVMEGAVRNGVSGIDGNCGGACACATCHVFVDGAWAAKLGEKSEMERSMLEFATDTSPNSRLSCQIAVGPRTDGLIACMPRSQQ